MKQYLKFLESAGDFSVPFDKTAQQVLEEIALVELSDPLTVGEAMKMLHIASPATIHRKLTDLLAFGYINFFYKGKNRRTKYLELTPRGIAYFNTMERFMLKVAK
jgi:DNA-binding MarR family transcriptional regulator